MRREPGRQVVLADDFTGAAEIAGIAWRSGGSVVLSRGAAGELDADVTVIDTDTRLLPGEEAAALVREVCEGVRDACQDGVFKKIDSVLRGNIVAEIEAALDGLGRDRAVVVSANPSRGRVIRDGRYSIGGVPLHRTEFADDPIHPAATDRVRDLVGNRFRIETPDAGSLGEVARIASRLEPGDLPAGGADFYAAWSGSSDLRVEEPGLPERRLWLCGSQAVRGQRAEVCRRLGIPVAVFDSVSVDAWVDEAVSAIESSGRAVMELSRGTTLSTDDLLAALGAAGREVIRRAGPGIVFVEGGATAGALLDRLGWDRFEVTRELGPGVVGLRADGSELASSRGAVEIVVKPGSYPWPAGVFTADG